MLKYLTRLAPAKWIISSGSTARVSAVDPLGPVKGRLEVRLESGPVHFALPHCLAVPTDGGSYLPDRGKRVGDAHRHPDADVIVVIVERKVWPRPSRACVSTHACAKEVDPPGARPRLLVQRGLGVRHLGPRLCGRRAQPSHAAQASELGPFNVPPFRLPRFREHDLAVAIEAKDRDGPPRALRDTLEDDRPTTPRTREPRVVRPTRNVDPKDSQVDNVLMPVVGLDFHPDL